MIMGKYGNVQKMIEFGNESWNSLKDCGLSDIRVRYTDTNRVITSDNHRFINMCSCSYLGLDRHPKIVQGAIQGLERANTVTLPTSRLRIGLSLIDEAEAILSQVFDCKARVTLSCGAASSGMLPLLASGYLTEKERPLMIFDKFVHFSMAHMKSSCGDETDILTCPHNDLAFIEDVCLKNPTRKIVYIADGAYSMGGYAPVEELEKLQDKYGLYLYFDDSHSLSAYGKNGVGYVRSKLKSFNDRTFIVASLGKAFGVCGGVILTAYNAPYEDFINTSSGPQAWSQPLNAAGLGGVIASAQIHLSDELETLQHRLQDNLYTFDKLCPTSNKDNGLPIRIIELSNSNNAIEFSKRLFEEGYYSSAVFFPIVAKGRAGLRIMMRADMDTEDITGFLEAVNKIALDYKNFGS
ncbi:Putative pyridoxal phosphate-dependent acyltransferase [Sporomusa rhizae]